MTDAMPLQCREPSPRAVPGHQPHGAVEVSPPRAEPIRMDAGRMDAGRTDAGRTVRARTECGDLPFLIRRDGTWLYRGSVVQRKELVCLFASVLRRDRDGVFWLETPAERGRIQVEDAPFVAVELDWRGCDCAQTLSFRTNVDQCVTVDEDHPLRVHRDPVTGEPTPYLLVRRGEGDAAVEARVNRATYYELVALAVPETVGGRRLLGVWSCRRFFPLGDVPEEHDGPSLSCEDDDAFEDAGTDGAGAG